METLASKKPEWLGDDSIRPYVLLTPEHQIKNPGTRHKFPWFDKDPLIIDPLKLSGLEFANYALRVDELMFTSADLGMPRWVFYDCAVLPGLVSGFAIRASCLDQEMKRLLKVSATLEWVPISLFIIIPTIRDRQWMAHNLCSVNDLVPKDKRWRWLGFLSKAFGLWYANVETLMGVTQWMRPAIKLHANFGYLSLVTAFTPIHDYPHSLTYRVNIDAEQWIGFTDQTLVQPNFDRDFEGIDYEVNPRNEDDLKSLQTRIETGKGPFFLSGKEVLTRPVGSPLGLYQRRLGHKS